MIQRRNSSSFRRRHVGVSQHECQPWRWSVDAVVVQSVQAAAAEAGDANEAEIGGPEVTMTKTTWSLDVLQGRCRRCRASTYNPPPPHQSPRSLRSTSTRIRMVIAAAYVVKFLSLNSNVVYLTSCSYNHTTTIEAIVKNSRTLGIRGATSHSLRSGYSALRDNSTTTCRTNGDNNDATTERGPRTVVEQVVGALFDDWT